MIPKLHLNLCSGFSGASMFSNPLFISQSSSHFTCEQHLITYSWWLTLFLVKLLLLPTGIPPSYVSLLFSKWFLRLLAGSSPILKPNGFPSHSEWKPWTLHLTMVYTALRKPLPPTLSLVLHSGLFYLLSLLPPLDSPLSTATPSMSGSQDLSSSILPECPSPWHQLCLRCVSPQISFRKVCTLRTM